MLIYLIIYIQKLKFRYYMKPINDRVVVKPAPAEERKQQVALSFLIQPKKNHRGEVVAVGPRKRW